MKYTSICTLFSLAVASNLSTSCRNNKPKPKVPEYTQTSPVPGANENIANQNNPSAGLGCPNTNPGCTSGGSEPSNIAPEEEATNTPPGVVTPQVNNLFPNPLVLPSFDARDFRTLYNQNSTQVSLFDVIKCLELNNNSLDLCLNSTWTKDRYLNTIKSNVSIPNDIQNFKDDLKIDLNSGVQDFISVRNILNPSAFSSHSSGLKWICKFRSSVDGGAYPYLNNVPASSYFVNIRNTTNTSSTNNIIGKLYLGENFVERADPSKDAGSFAVIKGKSTSGEDLIGYAFKEYLDCLYSK